MKRAIVLFAALLGACGASKELTADEIRNAMPQKESASINAPTSGSGVQAGLNPARDPAASNVGDVSGYYLSTATLAVAVNGSVAWSLGVLQAVVQWPPTSCDKTSCTWGPGSSPLDPRDWKLTVSKAGDHFDYQLAGQQKSQPDGFVTILSGSAYPSSPHRGHGSFLVDHEQGKKLGYTDTGTLEVSYDNRGDLAIDATFLGFTGSDGHLGNAVYHYGESATGGDLQVAFHDLTAAVDPKLALHSRWGLNGAGRGDADYSQATPAAHYTASECWSAASVNPPFRVVFYEDSAPSSAGAEASCAFLTASPPTLGVP